MNAAAKTSHLLTMKPLVLDLFCGLGGWSEAFIAEGYRAIGFDVERHDYGEGGYPGELVLRDVRSITGAELVKQYGVPNVIVASPPCQEFSYMAMPWKRAKEKMRKILTSPEEQTQLTDLFSQSFRIQREVSEAAGHYVPMIVENVRGAQRWVGKARWNFGSFYLWGDVPALMPIPAKAILKYGMICAAELKEKNGSSRVSLRDGLPEGVKGFTPNGEPLGKNTNRRMLSCGPNARKKASAEIAKIPPSLAAWIAKTFKSTHE